MVGLDAAGKTTILYKLKLGEIVTTIPTIGMLMICDNYAMQFSMLYFYMFLVSLNIVFLFETLVCYKSKNHVICSFLISPQHLQYLPRLIGESCEHIQAKQIQTCLLDKKEKDTNNQNSDDNSGLHSPWSVYVSAAPGESWASPTASSVSLHSSWSPSVKASHSIKCVSTV